MLVTLIRLLYAPTILFKVFDSFLKIDFFSVERGLCGTVGSITREGDRFGVEVRFNHSRLGKNDSWAFNFLDALTLLRRMLRFFLMALVRFAFLTCLALVIIRFHCLNKELNGLVFGCHNVEYAAVQAHRKDETAQHDNKEAHNTYCLSVA